MRSSTAVQISNLMEKKLSMRLTRKLTVPLPSMLTYPTILTAAGWLAGVLYQFKILSSNVLPAPLEKSFSASEAGGGDDASRRQSHWAHWGQWIPAWINKLTRLHPRYEDECGTALSRGEHPTSLGLASSSSTSPSAGCNPISHYSTQRGDTLLPSMIEATAHTQTEFVSLASSMTPVGEPVGDRVERVEPRRIEIVVCDLSKSSGPALVVQQLRNKQIAGKVSCW